MRILLADDQNEIRALVARQLELLGHHVVAVRNGQEALKTLELETFDAVLLDEEMPILGGVQAARAIRDREQELTARALLVALTGNSTDQDVQRLLAAGFDAVLGKPFNSASLSAVLSAHAPQLPRRPPPKSPPTNEPAAHLLEGVGGDSQLARQVIRTFLRDTPKRMAGLKRALKRRDSEAVASLAHAVKGSVGVFGADSARHHAQELQELAHQADLPGA